MRNATMKMSLRSLTSVFVLSAGLLVASSGTAQADLPADVIGCRAAIGKSATKLGKTVIRAVTNCHIERAKNGGMAPTDCNNLAEADLKQQVPRAQSKFKSYVASKCVGVTPAEALYTTCPSTCGSEVPSLDGMDDVADCIVCLARTQVQTLGQTIHGIPMSPLPTPDRSCLSTIGKASAKLFAAVLKDVTACQANEEGGGGESPYFCTIDAFPGPRTEDSLFDAENAVVDACDLSSFGNLDSCANSRFGVAICVGEETLASSQELSLGVLALEVLATTTTTSTTTTSTTLPPPDPQCPDLGELRLFSRDSNIPCSSNDDCDEPRTCNTTAGICVTKSDLDSGWTGHAHNSDLDNGVIQRSKLVCPGPAPQCGECFIAGIDPAYNVCRCANSTRTICDEPFEADADDCGGATCNCYFGAPIPLSSAGTPACIVNRYSQDIRGTANVDTGESSISARLRTQVFLGISTTQPCPICGGKCSNNASQVCIIDSDCGAGNTCQLDTPNDGVRDGLCFRGANTNATCDVMGINPSFPAIPGNVVGGSGYSLDCMPSVGINISGQGLALNVTQTTGVSTLAGTMPCAGGNCPCKVCSANEEEPCNTNSDCTGSRCTVSAAFSCTQDSQCKNLNLGQCTAIQRCQDAIEIDCVTNADCQNYDGGTCDPSQCNSTGSSGVMPETNGCNNRLCEGIPGTDEAQCTTGPDDKTCDGLVRADGSGILACINNNDCTANHPLNGACALTSRRKCFLDPIVAHGSASTEFPVGAATFCVPPTANGSINQVAGLPGPTRVVNQGASAAFCPGGTIQYEPGVGGCP